MKISNAIAGTPRRTCFHARAASGCCLSPGLVLLVLALWGASSYGAEVTGLYEAEVHVSERSAKQRTRAINEAFAAVLVKITGDRRVVTRPALAAAIAGAAQYVQQYRYRVPSERRLAQQPASASAPGWLLWTRFDSAAVDRTLRGLDLPVWGRTRPAVVLWLAVEERGRRYLVGPESRPDLVKHLQAEAISRGIPVLFPLLDLEDTSRLRFSDVWADFAQAVSTASQRYSPDVILVGRAGQARDRRWEVRWTLYEGRDAEQWQSDGGNLRQALRGGMQTAMDRVATRFAPVAGAGANGVIYVEVAGIGSPADYARVSLYLDGLTPVERADPQRVEPSSVRYRLRIRGGLSSLRQAIALGGTLDPIEEVRSGEVERMSAASTGGAVTGALEGVDGEGARRLSYRLRP